MAARGTGLRRLLCSDRQGTNCNRRSYRSLLNSNISFQMTYNLYTCFLGRKWNLPLEESTPIINSHSRRERNISPCKCDYAIIHLQVEHKNTQIKMPFAFNTLTISAWTCDEKERGKIILFPSREKIKWLLQFGPGKKVLKTHFGYNNNLLCNCLFVSSPTVSLLPVTFKFNITNSNETWTWTVPSAGEWKLSFANYFIHPIWFFTWATFHPTTHQVTHPTNSIGRTFRGKMVHLEEKINWIHSFSYFVKFGGQQIDQFLQFITDTDDWLVHLTRWTWGVWFDWIFTSENNHWPIHYPMNKWI